MVTSLDPRTGAAQGDVADTTSIEVARVLDAARLAAGAVAEAAPAARRDWLHGIARALEDDADRLVLLAESETALGTDRLRSELSRTAGQLRFYGDVAMEGSYLRVMLDEGDGARASLARVNVPLGPVAVFGASNFPFAFSVLANDTASAIAAGCPVVVKGHPAHPRLSEALAEIAADEIARQEAPAGTFALVSGYAAGVEIVTAPEIRAVAFTGSQQGGMALWQLAASRHEVIPVYAEMGTINPVVITRAAARERLQEIADGFVGSFTLGSGQYCTKPGLLFAPSGRSVAEIVADALRVRDPQPFMLTEAIASGVRAGVEAMVAAGARVVASVGGVGDGWSAPAVLLETTVANLRAGSRLLDECFGAVALVVEYVDEDELDAALASLQPALAASVFTGDLSDQEAPRMVRWLSGRVGRVVVNDWPTGVSYTWAQHHGGPWPATSNAHHTSVGAAALDRFVRPVAFQSTPDEWLPAAAQDVNAWGVPRRVNGLLGGPRD